MNLIDFGFQNSNLFRHMPLFDEISYAGHNEEKVRLYKASRENQACSILALNFIRKDEKILWDAVEDFLKRSTTNAASGARGAYIFDLLTIDIHKEIKTFKQAELATVIINAASKLAPGGAKMVKYSSVYALIYKTITGNWGKITFKTAVDVFKGKPDCPDLLIRQLLKGHIFSSDPLILLLNDLSQNPVFNLQDGAQQARINEVMAGLVPGSVEFRPEVYIQDRNGVRKFFCGAA